MLTQAILKTDFGSSSRRIRVSNRRHAQVCRGFETRIQRRNWGKIFFEMVWNEMERKRFENELGRYKDELEKFSEQRTAKLKRSNAQLNRGIVEREKVNREKTQLAVSLKWAELMEAVEVLAGSVTQDLNNVLCRIIRYPELILHDIPEDNPHRVPILTIKESGEKGAAVGQDLLALARMGLADTQVLDIHRIISISYCRKRGRTVRTR